MSVEDSARRTHNRRMTTHDDSNPELRALLAQRIAAAPQRRITFAEFMETVLYHPALGYYAANHADIGARGDFFTSPHLGADFGELVAEQFTEMWYVLGKPAHFQLVEMGAGQGILAVDILRYVRHNHPDFFDSLEYVIVERAPSLVVEQKYRLRGFVENWGHISWLTLDDLAVGGVTGCIFSNELVDAFPVHQIAVEAGRLREIYVTLPHDEPDAPFEEIYSAPSDPRLATFFDLVGLDFPTRAYPDGYRNEVNLVALDWMAAVAEKLARGYVLTIDYGYSAARHYSLTRARGTLQCYYRHTINDDPYQHLGQQDITAHIDFTALEKQGAAHGLETLGSTMQAAFLANLGIGERLMTLTGTRDPNMSQQDRLRRYEALQRLIHPNGLGGFGVLLQARGLTDVEREHILKGYGMSIGL